MSQTGILNLLNTDHRQRTDHWLSLKADVNHRPGWSVPAMECCQQSAYMPMRRSIQSPSQGQILRHPGLARICAGERWWRCDLLLHCSGDVHCRGGDSSEVNGKRQWR